MLRCYRPVVQICMRVLRLHREHQLKRRRQRHMARKALAGRGPTPPQAPHPHLVPMRQPVVGCLASSKPCAVTMPAAVLVVAALVVAVVAVLVVAVVVCRRPSWPVLQAN